MAFSKGTGAPFAAPNISTSGEGVMIKMAYCQVVGGLMMNICTPAVDTYTLATNLMPAPPKHLYIVGNVKRTSVIMANWSREMWRIVLSRIVQSLKSFPLPSSFYAVSVTIN